MTDIATHKWAKIACEALGYDSISPERYRGLCYSVRNLCPVLDRGVCWSDLTKLEQQTYVQRLCAAYPGLRDPPRFLSFAKHLLKGFKADWKRRQREKLMEGEDSEGEGDTGEAEKGKAQSGNDEHAKPD